MTRHPGIRRAVRVHPAGRRRAPRRHRPAARARPGAPRAQPRTPLPAQEQPETTPPAADEPPPAADPRPLLAILARTRTIEILVALGDSDTPTRYRTLAARLGTTMLSIRLRELTTAGLVDRHVEPGRPSRQLRLTPTAAPLLPPLRDILTWAATHTLAGQTPAPPAPAADEPLPPTDSRPGQLPTSAAGAVHHRTIGRVPTGPRPGGTPAGPTAYDRPKPEGETVSMDLPRPRRRVLSLPGAPRLPRPSSVWSSSPAAAASSRPSSGTWPPTPAAPRRSASESTTSPSRFATRPKRRSPAGSASTSSSAR
ncbi:helix-turn-helix domain-containing protein [Parafrankia sp. CH37]|uniref:winged helix-turn-helix transcriptional regulator n=1 Tax=Parafrankia sp. CH37 TaxID=683308 RepID=UPI001866E964|nr:winged helix-turn-helix transcriptional regulator [Parafrankia sp. CH37]MBE3206600.1 helix-turn-helix transcriptional regulator [Parafrankia sp. CH37]